MSKTVTAKPLKKAAHSKLPHVGRAVVEIARRGLRRSNSVVDCLLHNGIEHVCAGQVKGGLNTAEVIHSIQMGLPFDELEQLRASLDVPIEKLTPKLGISKATFHRRKKQGRLEKDESDRVVRFARLMGKAVAVLESEEAARRWLASPQFGLGGAIPLDYAQTEVGAREVEDLLGRIEYGVYS
jgi:putative toxin-antitoxin system antitoxin component (TIGR02293 family)